MSVEDQRLLADLIVGEAVSDAATGAVVESAVRHGVLGLFPLPFGPHAALLAAARARQLRALKFTLRVVHALDDAGVACVVLKGAAAGSRWSDPSLRQQSDVDVLVERSRKDDAARALISSGVCGERFIDSDAHHNDSLTPREPSGLLVEVHHDFSNHHDARVDVSELLARRVWLTTPQGRLPALAPEDDAVFLALHATTHALARLAWLVDLAVLPVDWVEAACRARRWNVALGVEPAWRRAREWLAAPIPEAAFDALGSSRAHVALARAILAASDATDGRLHQFFERSFRFSVVPFASMPSVLVRKLRARREEQVGYARKAERSDVAQ